MSDFVKLMYGQAARMVSRITTINSSPLIWFHLVECRTLEIGVSLVALKVHHSETHGRHRTPLGVAGFPIPGVLALDAVILGCEEESYKVELEKDAVERHGCVVGMMSDEEL